MSKEVPEASKSELRPDGWERFEKAVDVALHTAPIHRTKPNLHKENSKKGDDHS